jgi:hypothetical protein
MVVTHSTNTAMLNQRLFTLHPNVRLAAQTTEPPNQYRGCYVF